MTDTGPVDRTLVVGAGVRRLDPSRPDDGARAIVISGSDIAWVGDPAAAPHTNRRVDVDGWITPAFVDAHVHGTATGLSLTGLDLGRTRTLADALEALRRHAAASRDDPLLGTGWDDFSWPERRPPTSAEISVVAPGRTVLLERVDSHSCLVDAGTLAALPLDDVERTAVDRDERGRPTGWLKEAAAAVARAAVYGRLAPHRLAGARWAACRRAAALGIASVHEMGHPDLFGLEDALAWRDGDWPIDVPVWWASIDAESAIRHGLRCGGDLFLDGSIGSRTAAVTGGYRDGSGSGDLFFDDAAVRALFLTATRRGRSAGVHAIGDRAIEQAIAALETVARETGTAAVRACRHRMEHVELPRPDHPARMAALGVVASVQPAFDAAWGGDTGLYASRFGAPTALTTNPLSHFTETGVPLAFGSDSTVTPLGPWAGVTAAEQHRGGLGIDRLSAWHAHTLGGRFVAGQDSVGPITHGVRADVAVWDDDPLSVADPTALTCVGTWVRGTQIHPLPAGEIPENPRPV